MLNPKVFEGTWDELASHADELRRYPKLTLTVSTSIQPAQVIRYRADLKPEERIKAMDALAENNKRLPYVTDEAFDRENLYDERP
jgi:hypothetical protein